MPKTTDIKKKNSESEICDSCNQEFHRRGFASHQAACLKKADQRTKDAVFDARMKDRAAAAAQKQLQEGK